MKKKTLKSIFKVKKKKKKKVIGNILKNTFENLEKHLKCFFKEALGQYFFKKNKKKFIYS